MQRNQNIEEKQKAICLDNIRSINKMFKTKHV